jgi:RNA polymerase sigma-70 factor, ECF subfamily
MAARIDGELVSMLTRLRRFAISLCNRRELADDLVQIACEKALANADQFEPGTRFDSWMFRILRNTWVDHLRRSRTEGHPEQVDELPDLVGEEGVAVVEGRMTLRVVADAIAALPSEQREVLLLVSIEGLSYKEAAEVLEIPIGTVMSRLARARIKISSAAGIDTPAARS